MILAAYFNALDPIAVQLGPLAIRWYGLAYVLGFTGGYFLLVRLAKRGLIDLPHHRVADALLLLVLGVLLGGRLGYALVYDRGLLTGVSSSFPFWSLLAIHKGGMASHGGIAGVGVACWFISRGFRRSDNPALREGQTSFLHVTDIVSLCGPIGIFFGRLANFINGELLGQIVAGPGKPAPWWSVRYPQELGTAQAPALDPQQQGALTALVDKVASPMDGYNAGLARLVASAGRYRAELEPLVSARHASQLYQAVGEGLLVGVVVWLIAAKRRSPGVVTAWWLITYAVARVVTEIWRLPDAQFAQGRPMGLSRGQWLSVAMAVVGAGILLWVRRHAGVKRLGWAERRA